MSFFKAPGLAHTAYWRDRKILRYILGRVYGKNYLEDKEYKPYRGWVLTLFAVAGYLIWAGILVGILLVLLNFWGTRDFLWNIAMDYLL